MIPDLVPPPRPPLAAEELRDTLDLALRAGQLMLENGANTLRVEETTHRLGTALGADWMDVYATPSGIIATAASQGHHLTRVLRIVRSGIDLSRLAAVVDISRRAEAGELGRAAVGAALEQAAAQPRVYGRWTTALGVGVGCACFGLLFGGGPPEVLVAGLSSIAAQILRDRLGRSGLSRLLTTVMVAAFASGLALLLSELLGAPRPELALLASVLLLVPGALLVSSVADLFRGDLISGLARGAAAAMAVTAIGSGIWATLLLSGAQVTLVLAQPPPLWIGMPAALLAAGGFAMLFDVPHRALLLCALAGALAYGARQLGLEARLPPEAAIFLGGAAAGLMAELLARAQRLPSSIFAIPGFIPLVPGVAAFRTVLDFVGADYAAGTAGLVRTALLVSALAAGLGTASALARSRQRTPF